MSRRDALPSERLERMVTELKSAGMSYRAIGAATGLATATVWRAGAGDLRDPSHVSFVKIEGLHRERCGQTRKATFREF